MVSKHVRRREVDCLRKIRHRLARVRETVHRQVHIREHTIIVQRSVLQVEMYTKKIWAILLVPGTS